MSVSDRLDADRIRAGLVSPVIGHQIVVLEHTSSTNDEIARLAQAGESEGAVVFAEHQTAGRGQRGNVWESTAKKGLWFSILLRPQIPLQDSGTLTSWTARVVANTIEKFCSLEARVKPPNDVYISGRKVGGVLVEMKAQPGAPHLAILGVGINVNQTAANFSDSLRDRATSLLLVTGREQDRTALAIALLESLNGSYTDVTTKRSAQRL